LTTEYQLNAAASDDEHVVTEVVRLTQHFTRPQMPLASAESELVDLGRRQAGEKVDTPQQVSDAHVRKCWRQRTTTATAVAGPIGRLVVYRSRTGRRRSPVRAWPTS